MFRLARDNSLSESMALYSRSGLLEAHGEVQGHDLHDPYANKTRKMCHVTRRLATWRKREHLVKTGC
jgi:hypothetical protein